MRKFASPRVAAVVAMALTLQAPLQSIAWAHDFPQPPTPSVGSPDAPADPNGPQSTVNNSSDSSGCPPPFDPVDLHTGEFILRRQDVFWPGRQLPAEVNFTYRSRSAYNGQFGYGWNVSCSRRIRKLANNNLVVLRGTNRIDEFTFSAPNTYTAPPGIYDTLIQNQNGGYTLTSKHGVKETYNTNGKLTVLQDRNGNQLTFSYDQAGLFPVIGPSAFFVNQPTGVIAREYRLTKITDTVGRQVALAYNGEGRLDTITYSTGVETRTITYGYDAAGDLTSVTTPPTPDFPSGNMTQYVYTNHNLTDVIEPKIQTSVNNSYDTHDCLRQQTHGSGTSFLNYSASPHCPANEGFGEAGFSVRTRVYRVTPGSQIVVSWTAPPGVDGSIRLFRQGATNDVGSIPTRSTISGAGILTVPADAVPDNYEARFISGTARATSNTIAVQPASTPAATEVLNRNSVRTVYQFDPEGHITRQETFTDGDPFGEPASYVTLYEYNAAGERTRIQEPKGNATEFTYDAKGNLLEIRRKQIGKPPHVNDPTDIFTTFTYEPNFNFIKTVTNPRLSSESAKVTTYTYDYELGEPIKGNLRRITYPTVPGGAPQAVFTYTGFGQLDTVTDPTNVVTKYVYAPATGYLSQVTEGFGTALAGTTKFTYDTVGNIKTIEDPLTHVTSFNYNLQNQLTDTTAPTPLAFKTFYTYDANGNLIHVDRQLKDSAPGPRPAVDAVNPADDWQSTLYAYTNINQLQSVTDDLNNTTTFGYDGTGNRSFIQDAKGITTSFVYDERNLLFRVFDPAGLTENRYDPNGNLEFLLDAKGNTTQYVYDALNRLTDLTYPGGTATEHYGYDSASNLTNRLNARSQPITYVYDALNRLMQKMTPSETATYTYDKASRIKVATNPAAGLTHDYDARGRLSKVTYASGKTFLTDYDTASNRKHLTYQGGPTITYTYDELNRLINHTDLNGATISYTYDALSRRKTLALPNTVNTAYAYDSANRLLNLTTKKGATPTLSNFAYTYDELGNRQTMTDAVGLHTYGYDTLSQLTSSDEPVGGTPDLTFQYDALGNRLQRTRGANVQTYTPNQLNQYDQVDSTTYTYDLDGNLENDGEATYTYDAENRLTQVIKGPTTTNFTYDPFGRRASKTVNGAKTTFFYDGDDLLMEGNADGSQAQARYLYGPGIDEPLEMKRGTTTSYYSADGLGSIAHLTNAAGNIAERYTYETFGKLTIKNASGTELPTSAFGNRFTFTGREWDSEAGLYYHRKRYQNPRTGSFLSRDPLGYISDPNLYTYVANNPLNWRDPSGTTVIAIGAPIWTVIQGTLAGLGITVGTAVTGVLGVVAVVGTIILVNDLINRGLPIPVDSPISPAAPLQCSSHIEGMSQPIINQADAADVDDILADAQPGKADKSKQYAKPGGLEQANKDFDSLAGNSPVADHGGGVRSTTLPNGTRVSVRPNSTAGKPTVEINPPKGQGGPKIKIRY